MFGATVIAIAILAIGFLIVTASATMLLNTTAFVFRAANNIVSDKWFRISALCTAIVLAALIAT